MSLNNLMEQIGEDADLLTYNDEWLEQERVKRAGELERAAEELRAILLAQKIKKNLQQKNLVAMQQIVRDADGEIKSMIVRVVNLPDALSMMRSQQDTADALDTVNIAAQLDGWARDGYDIAASAALR